jgi:YHS domain-containing protein
MANDPICGMIVDEATALRAERDGQTYYFCSIVIGNALRLNVTKI